MDQLDAAVVGGGPAGLSAALLLGRSRRRVVIADGNEPRNAQSHASHNFLMRDGIAPEELWRIGREQLAIYPTIAVWTGDVTDARTDNDGFLVSLSDGSELSARCIVLATGFRDLLPEIEGIAERYGRSVFHCPYCDGWEQRDRPLAVLVEPAYAEASAMMIQHGSHELVLLTHGEPLDADVVRRLEQADIPRHGPDHQAGRTRRPPGTDPSPVGRGAGPGRAVRALTGRATDRAGATPWPRADRGRHDSRIDPRG